MKKTFNLTDLDCANCAAKMECGVAKLEGVKSAEVSFLTQKMTIEAEEADFDRIMKQLPIKQYGAYLRKMAIDGYILVIDRSDTKAYIRELQAVSRNINQIAKRANATGAVYQQDIEDIKKAVDEIWRLQRRTLLNQP